MEDEEQFLPVSSLGNTAEQQVQFAQVLELLEQSEALLLNPTPDNIEAVGQLIEPAATLLADHEHSFGPLSPAELSMLQSRCRVVQVLLAEALKVQWYRMHKLGASHESYNVNGKRSCWLPRISSFAIEA